VITLAGSEGTALDFAQVIDTLFRKWNSCGALFDHLQVFQLDFLPGSHDWSPLLKLPQDAVNG
jgi:hypothetical protein